VSHSNRISMSVYQALNHEDTRIPVKRTNKTGNARIT